MIEGRIYVNVQWATGTMATRTHAFFGYSVIFEVPTWTAAAPYAQGTAKSRAVAFFYDLRITGLGRLG